MFPLDKVPLCFLFVSHFKHKYNIVAEFINIDAVGDAVVKITRWRSNANGIEKFFYAHDLAALGEYGNIGVSAVARNFFYFREKPGSVVFSHFYRLVFLCAFDQWSGDIGTLGNFFGVGAQEVRQKEIRAERKSAKNDKSSEKKRNHLPRVSLCSFLWHPNARGRKGHSFHRPALSLFCKEVKKRRLLFLEEFVRVCLHCPDDR